MALAAQKTLENLIGGISLLLDRAIQVGDFCKIGDRVGTVDEQYGGFADRSYCSVDSSPPSGLSIYQQLFQSAVGLAGATQNFDGNGHYVRATVGGGANQIQTPPLSSAGALYGNSVLPVLGTFPSFPSTASAPTLKSNVPCYTQTAPNLNSATRGNGP